MLPYDRGRQPFGNPMKQYVLDEPSPDAPLLDEPAAARPTLPRQPWPWRALLVLAIVEPVALGALYLAVNGDAHPRARSEPIGPATIAAFAFAPGQSGTAPVAVADSAGEESRIAFERGRYVIDLRSTEIRAALAMLARATNAKVHGVDALAREPTRLSRSAVVATPAEAWQAVLGDVANFAISCAPKGCAVFVSAVGKADAKPPTLAFAPPVFAPADVGSGPEMPTVDPIAAAAAITAAAAAVNAAPGAPDGGESGN